MNATKRKFNALLQGLGSRRNNSDTNSTPSSSRPGSSSTTERNSSAMLVPSASFGSLLATGDLDLTSKRRRVSVLPSTPTKNGLSSPQAGSATGATTISNVVLRKWTGSPVKDTANQAPSRYCPGDREQLLRRLATFQEITDWTPKPDRVSEIEWAKKGWMCQGKERVRCSLCNKEIVVKLNRKEVDGKEVPVLVPSEIEDALVEKYVELMVTSHQGDCLWRKKGCDDSLLRVPLANAKTALESLRQRYDELCARNHFLPYEFNLRLPEGLDVDAILSYLPPDFFAELPQPSNPSASATGKSAQSTQPSRAALALAVLGWQGLRNVRIGPVPNSASCHTCLRRLGLWMFKSKEVDPETNTILVPAPMDHLDPVREHRFFCPWRDGALQRNPGGSSASRPRSRSATEPDKAGWEVLVQVLKNDSYLRNRNNNNSTRPQSRAGPPGTPAHARSTGTAAGTPKTPSREGQDAPIALLGQDGQDEGEEEDEATRAAKDKERWARLRRVKSLFDTKAGKKLRRPISRPGTGHSSIQPGE